MEKASFLPDDRNAAEILLTGHVIKPETSEYDKARQTGNRRFNKYPRVIVFTQSTRDVVNAVRWARKNRAEIRIRSGRHSYEAYSVAEDAVVIDVSPMKKIYVDSFQGIAHIQAGVTNLELNKTLGKAGFAFPGGSCQSVGVAGMALGGGISMLSRAFGLTCDNLLGLEMVDADGSILEVTDTCNPDLMWACRGGGGGNFGIVTALTFRIFPVTEVTVFQITWDFSQSANVLHAWQYLTPTLDHRLGSQIVLRSEKSALPVSTSGLFLGNKPTLQRMIKPLLTAGRPISVNIVTIPWLEAVNLFAAETHFSGQAFKNSSAFTSEPLSPTACHELCSFLTCVESETFAVQLVALGGAIASILPENTAFYHREAEFILQYIAFWDDPAEATAQIRRIETLRRRLLPFTAGAYANYPDQLIKNYDYSYYGANLPRLRQIKTKYDPTDFFHFRQSILPYNNEKNT